PGMIAVADSKGQLEYANKPHLDFTGATIEELRKLAIQTFHPDDQEMIQNEWLRRSAVGEPFDLDCRRRRFDGVYRWVHIRVDPLRDHQGRVVRWYGFHTDIEDQRRAEEVRRQSEEKIRQSERNLRQILDLTPLHITEFGPNGGRLYNNRAALDYHGLTLEEWQSADLKTLFHPHDAER